MNSLLKAFLLSASVFVLVILGILFFRPAEEKVSFDETPEKTPPAAEPSGKEPGSETPTLTVLPRRGTVKLTVEVLQKGSGRRLPGSRVLVSRRDKQDASGQPLYDSGSRKTTGLFQIDLPPGGYDIRVSCLRYKGDSRSVKLLAKAPQRIAFELGRGNSISGRILTPSGRPIAGARVLGLEELVDPNADLEETLLDLMTFYDKFDPKDRATATDISAEDGSYQLAGLELKTYTVRAVAAGHTPNEVEEVPAPRGEVNVVLAQGSSTTGVVQDHSGLGVEGATVSAFQALESSNVFKVIQGKTRPPVDTSASDPDGHFQFDTLGPGLYHFRIEAEGYQPSEELNKRVADGTSLAFTLKPGLVLRGFVSGPDNEPVAGARVRASMTGKPARRGSEQISLQSEKGHLVTDEQGEFLFDTLAQGIYTVLCWHAEEDYATLRHNDVHVRTGMDPLNLKLLRGGRMRGTVLDAFTGEAIAGARISTNDVAELQKDDFSQADGSFLLRGLATSALQVHVNAPGYSSETRKAQVGKDREIEANFELTPTGVVSGRVINGAGDPIDGARVMAKTDDPSSPTLAMDLTDPDGNFSLKGIRAGEGRWIRAKKPQYLEGNSDVFDIAPSENLDIGTLRLALGASLKGIILGDGGKGVPNCKVIVAFEGETDLQYGGNPSGHTNSEGEFTIGGLEGGRVDLVIQAAHFIEKHIEGVQVVEGQQFTLDPIHLEQGNSVTGRVVDTRGKPVANAEVVARDYSQGAKELRTSSAADGTFKVENILSNDLVELTVDHKDFGSYSDENVSADASDLEIVLKEYGRLRGMVFDSNRIVLPSFVVEPQEPEDSRDARKKLKQQSFSSSDGAFEYTGVPGGLYTIAIRAPKCAAVIIQNVTVEEGKTLDLGEITLTPDGIVSGTVIDSRSGAPLPGARVKIVQGLTRFKKDAGSTATEQQTDDRGGFDFSGLKGGNLTLRVSHPGYVTHRVKKVNPGSAAVAQNITVELDQSGEISGVVVDTEGQAKVSMSVFLMGSRQGRNQRTQTDRQGRFSFFGVGAGTFAVKAHKFGSSGTASVHAEISVDMAPGQIKEVELQVQ